MADILLFHSVLGPRPGVADAADRLRSAGHTVHTPDFFGGKTFDDYPEAFEFVESLGGIPELITATRKVAADLPPDLVYAGFSLGGVSAELLAATRPGARGLILLHAAIPVEEFEVPDWPTGVPAWPAGVPAQVHYGTGDPFREQPELEGFERAVRASGSLFELFDYPVSGHLFTDRTLTSEYDEPSAELLFPRVLAFLDRLGPR
jgi:dienelactone hydrolase